MLSSVGRHSEKACEDTLLRGAPSVCYLIMWWQPPGSSSSKMLQVLEEEVVPQSKALRYISAGGKVADMKLCSTGKTKVRKRNKPTKG